MESTYRVEWVSGSEGIFEDVMTGIFQVWIYIYIYRIMIVVHHPFTWGEPYSVWSPPHVKGWCTFVVHLVYNYHSSYIYYMDYGTTFFFIWWESRLLTSFATWKEGVGGVLFFSF
jgi:hypothetical protein